MSAFKPTPDQKSVITSDANTRWIIESGPGTGKTAALLARLAHLVNSAGLSTGEILVLSFSVAAVQEVKKRLAELSTDTNCLHWIDVRTFDSFASKLLRLGMASDDLRKLNYDQRIEAAIRTIQKEEPNAMALLRQYRYLFIDECQDLVGLRADFCLRVLEAARPGFVLFADSAQAIYDFQLKSGNGPSSTTSSQFLAAVRAAFPEIRCGLSFRKNFRVDGNAALLNVAEKGRVLLLESPEQAQTFLQKFYSGLEEHGSIGLPKIPSDLHTRSTCVVCRTNGQVLRLASALLKAEPPVPFEIVRSRNDYCAPPWLGRAFFGFASATMSRAQFLEIARAKLGVTAELACSLWEGLCVAVGVKKPFPSVTAAQVRGALSEFCVLPDLPGPASSGSPVLLSTIHKSKGREYSDVIVVMRGTVCARMLHLRA